MADFLIEQQSEVVPARVNTQNSSKNAESFEWDFGDGTISTEQNPSHQYELSGKYVVTLKAKAKNKVSTKTQEIVFEAPQQCLVLMKTSMGDMLIHLYDQTPKHRDNMVKLIEEDFYNELLFHRVIKGFMVQGGDPNSRGADEKTRLGSGGPGYTVPAEFQAELVHFKGALAAARQGDNVNPEKNSSGSQFYIVHGGPVSDQSLNKQEKSTGIIYSEEVRNKYKELGGTPFLDYGYTVFGQVLEGMDVVDKIATTQTKAGDRPVEDVKILEVILVK